MRRSAALQVVISPTPSARFPAGAAPIPHDISHQAAQAELNALLFPHYLLGRQLALEETMRELLLLLNQEQRQQVVEKLHFQADQAMQRLQAGIADQKDDAATCGYVCAMLQQGF